MANPSTEPAAANWAEPTSTGGVCGPAVLTINEVLAANTLSNDAASRGPATEGCCGNATGNASGPLGSPNKLRRACAEAAPLLMSVNVVVQFSSAAMCGMEPRKARPGMEAACCSMVKEKPAMVSVAERQEPKFEPIRYVTEPVPSPDRGLVNETQVGAVVAVQTHPFCAVTITLPSPPSAGNPSAPGPMA